MFEYLHEGTHKAIEAAVRPLICRADELSLDKAAGVLAACIALKGSCWADAIASLAAMEPERRSAVLKCLGSRAITPLYGGSISAWVTGHWERLDPWHFEFADYIVSKKLSAEPKVLKLSLVL